MRKRIISLAFHNIQYKVAALLLGCISWYVVQGEEVLELNRRVLVHINVPEGYVIKGDPIRVKDATLRSSRAVLGNFPSKPLEARLQIPAGKIGKRRFLLSKVHFKNLDSRVKLTLLDPYVTVYVGKKFSREVPIKVTLQGLPAEGYIIEKTNITPSLVEITGIKEEIIKVREVVTESIDISGIQENKTVEAKLIATDFESKGLSVEKVSVKLLVGEEKINRRFTEIPIEVVGSDYLSSITPKKATIVIQGKPSILSFIKNSDLRAFVETRDLLPGNFDKRIQVQIPPETVLIETLPENAKIKILSQKKID